MAQAITHIFELLGHTYKLLTFIAWRMADLDDRAAAEMAEATRWPLSDRERAMQKLLAGEE